MLKARMENETQRAPHNIEAEQALLGALLIDNPKYDRVRTVLKTEHFYDAVHGEIYAAIARRLTDGKTASAVLLKPDFDDHPGLAQIGGAGYLARLAGAAISTFDIGDHAEQIRDLWMRRSILSALDEAERAVQGQEDMQAVAGAVEAQMMLIHDQARSQDRSETALSAAVRAVERMNDAYQAERALGLMTGISELDEATGGMLAPEVWTLAGRSSMGKTAVALHICKSVADQGVPVFFASLEMDAADLMQRVCSSIIKAEPHAVPYQAMRSAHKLTEDQFRVVVEGMRKVENMPLYISPPSMREIGAIRAEARAVARRSPKPLGLICVDYLQRVGAPGQGIFETTSNAMAAMKRLATDHDCPVLCLAQLSRAVESRAGTAEAIPRPRLSDLKGTGNIEEDSDAVILVHRDDYYLDRMANPTDSAKRARLYELRAKAKGWMDLQLAKFRGGEIADFRVKADLAFNTILPPQKDAQEGFDL